MKSQFLIKKYSILLLIYVIIYYVIQPYGLRMYYSMATAQPDFKPETVSIIQSLILTLTLLLNFIYVIFVFVDSKRKKMIDWMILLITLFRVELGILLFLIWQIYKEVINNDAQQHV